ncbi:hypothetical protein SEUCBS140593_002049 [Sporothrix eucalyptigena]|uniref:Uncharacterized protein n=1 Tax=Sporothrix eucalyptigena TaxID=1812306 RepID=A0ABP0B3Y8_9PEZI
MSSRMDSGDGKIPKRRRPHTAVACERSGSVLCVQARFPCSFKTRPAPTPATSTGWRPNADAGDSASIDSSVSGRSTLVPWMVYSVAQPPVAQRAVCPAPAPSRILTSLTSLVGADTLAPIPMTESAHAPYEGAEGLGDINQHTHGVEFYGRTGTFYFLSQLQSHAKGCWPEWTPSRPRNPPARLGQPRQDVQTGQNGPSSLPGPLATTAVNLLHCSDYPSSAPNPCSVTMPTSVVRTELERECARLYFMNLHCVHPVIDQTSFLERCEREVWAYVAATPASRFLALFNIVLAVGAITAEDTTLAMWKGMTDFLDQAFQQDGLAGGKRTDMSIKAAHVFFEKAKFHLGDAFESSSFETV